MNIIILGAGKSGEALVSDLVKEKHDITVIDEKAKNIENIVNKYDVKGLVGNGVKKDILTEASVGKADFFIASTTRDEVNVICCTLAKKMGARFTVARVRDPEYYTEIGSLKEELSIDMIFNPQYETALEIARILKFPSANNVESFAGGFASLAEFNVTEDNPIIGKAIADVVKEYQTQVVFATVERGDKILVPFGDFVFEEGDVLSVIAKDTEITNFCKKLHIFKMPAKNVFIVGGGITAYYLAKKLIENGVDVKIVEKDEARAEELSNVLPEASVLLGDGSDGDLFIEEKIAAADACIVLTGVDEENAMISLLAKRLGVGKVITKIGGKSVLNMVKFLGLDSVVSPLEITADKMIRFVRSRQNYYDGRIKKLYRFGDKTEVLEFKIAEGFPTDVPLRELKLKKQILIGGIVRGEEYILPTGGSTFKNEDKIIVIAPARKITELDDIISKK